MIPQELKDLKQWIVWKDNKQPYSAITMKQQGWQKEGNWTSYSDALRVCKECSFGGLGFVFKYPYVGIDLDDCIDESGMMNDFSRGITNTLSTFTEYSRSSKGLHLYCKVTEPVGVLKTEFMEIYSEGRYFIVTGKVLDANQDKITDQTENVKKLIEKYKPAKITGISSCIEKRRYKAGMRNNGMAAEIGRLFNYYDKDTVYNLAHTLNQTICEPPLDDEELNIIIESIGKRDIKQILPKPIAQSMEQKGWSHIEGMRNLDEVPYRGLAKMPGKYIPTGMESIDYATNDLTPGCVTLVVGRSNGGKTTFVRQIIVNAICLENKIFIISGEGDQEISINSLYRCVIGRDKRFYDLIKINKRYIKEPKEYVLSALKEWHKGKLKMFDKHESKFKATNELFKLIEYEAKTNKHNLIVIDNLMSILAAKAVEKNEAQAEFMQHCCDLAKIYKTHIILVLHPNKEYRNSVNIEMEHISGSSDLYNKADNIIAVIREYDETKRIQGINGKVKLLKNRYYSELPECTTHFDEDTGLLLEIKAGEVLSYDFNWMKYLNPDKVSGKQWWEVAEEELLNRGEI